MGGEPAKVLAKLKLTLTPIHHYYNITKWRNLH